jgi:hypothetical protein
MDDSLTPLHNDAMIEQRNYQIWDWPEEDESAYQELTQSAVTWREYRTAIAMIQADLERQGKPVERVYMTVAEMKEKMSTQVDGMEQRIVQPGDEIKWDEPGEKVN